MFRLRMTAFTLTGRDEVPACSKADWIRIRVATGFRSGDLASFRKVALLRLH